MNVETIRASSFKDVLAQVSKQAEKHGLPALDDRAITATLTAFPPGCKVIATNPDTDERHVGQVRGVSHDGMGLAIEVPGHRIVFAPVLMCERV